MAEKVIDSKSWVSSSLSSAEKIFTRVRSRCSSSDPPMILGMPHCCTSASLRAMVARAGELGYSRTALHDTGSEDESDEVRGAAGRPEERWRIAVPEPAASRPA